jgi:hypothetical protein
MHVATLKLLITLVLTLGLWGGLAWAAFTFILSYNFEDGIIPNSNTLGPNAVPTTIMTEGTNEFLRMTASPSDCGDAFGTTCPRTRAELLIGHDSNVTEIVTYSFKLRYPSSNPSGQNQLSMQTYQGFFTYPNYTSRLLWIGLKDGRVYLANRLPPVPQTSQYVDLGTAGGPAQIVDLGPVAYDTWITYALSVNWSTDPLLAWASVTKNGVAMGSITGQPTLAYTQSTPDMFTDVISFDGVLGIADFDNVQIGTGGSTGDSTPPAPPTALRVQ